MAGSTGLEPAASGLTGDNSPPRKWADYRSSLVKARRRPLAHVGPGGATAGGRGHRTGTLDDPRGAGATSDCSSRTGTRRWADSMGEAHPPTGSERMRRNRAATKAGGAKPPSSLRLGRQAVRKSEGRVNTGCLPEMRRRRHRGAGPSGLPDFRTSGLPWIGIEIPLRLTAKLICAGGCGATMPAP